MSLPDDESNIEVGVRELHDQLSRYLRHVSLGGEVVVTMRGRRVARLTGVDAADPLEDLRARGLVRDPQRVRQRETGRKRLTGVVSDLVNASVVSSQLIYPEARAAAAAARRGRRIRTNTLRRSSPGSTGCCSG